MDLNVTSMSPLSHFRLEGILTCLVASISPWLVKDWPAHFLVRQERYHVLDQLAKDANEEEHEFHGKCIWQAFKDFKMYIMALIYLGANCRTYAIAFFLPTIINKLGYAAATYDLPKVLTDQYRAQLMTVLPYILRLRRDHRMCVAIGIERAHEVCIFRF